MVALLLELEPKLVPDEVRDRLVRSASPLGGIGRDAQGAGLTQARDT
jgi:hypothetical protein